MPRRRALAALGSAGRAGAGAAGAAVGRAKVLRYAFPIAETGFDPAQISDLYSRTVTPHIFEALLRLRPPGAAGQAPAAARAAAMPEVVATTSATWTIRLAPGIYFADDPAFKGRRRELVAADYVYSLKRVLRSGAEEPGAATARGRGHRRPGGAARGGAARRSKPFDYDREIEGLRALDRYTLQFRSPSRARASSTMLADGDIFGAVAREVVEDYGERIAEHPVGTGPFRLAQWRRSSRIVLERNPSFREESLRRRARRRRRRGPGAAARASRAGACR